MNNTQVLAKCGTYNTTLSQVEGIIHQGCIALMQEGIADTDYTGKLLDFLRRAPEEITYDKQARGGPVQVYINDGKLHVAARVKLGENKLTKRPILDWKTWTFAPTELASL